MNLRKCARLALETLEDRAVPAVTAGVFSGNLVVAGDPSAQVTITASHGNANKVADTFKIMDGTKTVGTFSGVSRDLSVHLGAGNSNLTVNLAGLSAPRNVQVDLGAGNDAFNLVNGAVDGRVSVAGGPGADRVVLGGTAALTVNGDVDVRLGGSRNDAFQLEDHASVKGSLTVLAAQSVELNTHSLVTHNLNLVGGQNGLAANLHGQVGRNLRVLSTPFGTTAGSTLSVGGTVGGNVLFIGSDKADVLTVTGKVGGNIDAELRGGNDTAMIGGTVGGSVNIDTGAGNDTTTLAGSVRRHVLIIGGQGNDTLVLTATARLQEHAEAQLGSGNDTFELDAHATFTTLRVQGGRGTNTFVGKARSGLSLIHF